MKVDGQAAVQEIYPVKAENRAPNPQANARGKVADFKVPEKEPAASGKDVQEAVAFANKAMKMANYHLEFELHEKSERYQVKVIDSDSGEVIREIPTDAMMKFADNIKSSLNQAAGLVVDELV
jgi:flagellar protein FlaG